MTVPSHGKCVTVQSQTGGVLGAVLSAAVMGAAGFFFQGGGGKFRDAKKFPTFLFLTFKA